MAKDSENQGGGSPGSTGEAPEPKPDAGKTEAGPASPPGPAPAAAPGANEAAAAPAKAAPGPGAGKFPAKVKAPKPADGKPRPPRAPRSQTDPHPILFGLLKRTWIVLLLAVVFSVGVYFAFVVLFTSGASKEAHSAKLGMVYKNPKDNFSIQPPMLWKVRDTYPGASAVLIGLAEKGFNPMIVVALQVKDGTLADYVKAHKAEVEEEDATVKWVSEGDDTIDGAPAKVLEYTYQYAAVAVEPYRVYCRRYIVDDHPRFYRVSLAVADSVKDGYIPSFEASARTFKRLPLPPMMPRVIPEGGAEPAKAGNP